MVPLRSLLLICGKERSRRRCWRIVKGARRGHRSGEGTRRAAPRAHRLRCPMLGMWRIVKGARRGHRSGEGTRRAAPKAHRLRCPMLGMAGITAHRPPCRMNLGRCRRGTICLIQSTSMVEEGAERPKLGINYRGGAEFRISPLAFPAQGILGGNLRTSYG